MTNQQGAPEALPDPSPDQLRAIARTAPISAYAGRLQGIEQVAGKACVRDLLEAKSEGGKP